MNRIIKTAVIAASAAIGMLAVGGTALADAPDGTYDIVRWRTTTPARSACSPRRSTRTASSSRAGTSIGRLAEPDGRPLRPGAGRAGFRRPR